jgi:hypothetical protein
VSEPTRVDLLEIVNLKSIPPNAVEQSAIKKIALRLVPFLALMFFINYLDRTAISFAGPAAVALYLWSRDATKRGVKTWHIAAPAAVGAISIPVALFMGSATGTVAVITVTACSIFAALPSFWTIPSQFLTGAAAAAGIALINTAGNFAGFAAGYITGTLKDWTGTYVVPMFLVGGFMLLSAICMVAISAQASASSHM